MEAGAGLWRLPLPLVLAASLLLILLCKGAIGASSHGQGMNYSCHQVGPDTVDWTLGAKCPFLPLRCLCQVFCHSNRKVASPTESPVNSQVHCSVDKDYLHLRSIPNRLETGRKGREHTMEEVSFLLYTGNCTWNLGSVLVGCMHRSEG